MDEQSDKKEDLERNRLQLVMIPQQFAWTGLTTRQVSAAAAPDKDNYDSVNLDDRIVWNILGYSIDNSPDYLSCRRVCKQWKDVVDSLTPPVVFRMSRSLHNKDDHGENNKIIPLAEGISLWRQALWFLVNSSSPLYRNSTTTNHEIIAQKGWPCLQPQFSVTMMTFFYELCTQRDLNNRTSQLYKVTVEFLTEFFQQLMSKVVRSFEAIGSNNAQELFEKLGPFCRQWQGVSQTVADICHYLDCYYVPNNGVPSIQEKSTSLLEVGWATQLGSKDYYKDALPGLLDCGKVIALCKLLAADEVRLEVKAVYETLQAVTTDRDQLYWINDILAQLIGLDTSGKKLMKTKETRPVVMQIGGERFELDAGCHFLKSSAFLSRLKLQPGDSVQLKLEVDTVSKILQFYTMDEASPMRQIPKPIRSLLESVGEEYDSFVSAFDMSMLYSMIRGSDLLQCRKLLDLCCARVAEMIIGRTPEEIRATFGIDFE